MGLPGLRGACALLCSISLPAWGRDTFDQRFRPEGFVVAGEDMQLVLRGQASLLVHDIEGRGGPGLDSATDTATLGTRSPTARADGLWLAPRFGLGERWWVLSELGFTPSGASLGALWLDVRTGGPVVHHVEAGLHTPLGAIDPRMARTPLAGRLYWDPEEVHLSWDARSTGAVWWRAGAGISVLRPLGTAPLLATDATSGILRAQGYTDAAPYSGNGPAGLVLAGFGWGPVFVEGFGQAGRLAEQGGTDVLRSLYARVAEAGGTEDRAAFWAGGRFGLRDLHNDFVVEAITSGEGPARRTVAYAQVGRALRLRDPSQVAHRLEPALRVETLRFHGDALRHPAVSQSVSWDVHLVTLALALWWRGDHLVSRLEGTRHLEEGPGEPLDDDEIALWTELRF